MTFTDRDMRDQVAIALGGYTAEYDMEAIVDDVQARYGTVDIDSVPDDEFWAIVERHDRGSR